MIPILLILFPLLGGLASLAVAMLPSIGGTRSVSAARTVSALAAGIQLLALLTLCIRQISFASNGTWLFEWRGAWIPQIGASFHLGADSLSLILLTLTAFLGFIAVLMADVEGRRQSGAFFLCLLATVSAVSGAFLALDLLLFFFFFEIMLVPMFFLIVLWGKPGEKPFGAALRFFLFTQAGGLAMLLALLALYGLNGRATGTYTLDYDALRHAPLAVSAAIPLLLGFCMAFAVKLPVFPFHGWQPRAYAAVPAAAGILLSGAMAKVGAYGLIRFGVSMFPEAAGRVAPWAMGLAVFGILYAGVLAFAQRDLRRVIAYSSMGHMGFILLGVFSLTPLGYAGTIVQIVAHGCSVAGLFVVAAMLERTTGTCELDRLGGLWERTPRLGAFTLIMVMATLALPGLGNFVGEFLVLLGTFQVNPAAAVLAALGGVLSAAYGLRLMSTIFYGPTKDTEEYGDLSGRTAVCAVLLVMALLTLGLYPKLVLHNAGLFPGMTPPSQGAQPHGDRP